MITGVYDEGPVHWRRAAVARRLRQHHSGWFRSRLDCQDTVAELYGVILQLSTTSTASPAALTYQPKNIVVSADLRWLAEDNWQLWP